MPNNKEIIVKAIQNALTDSLVERSESRLKINNHLWVSNYNHIFSNLLSLNDNCELFVYEFQRHSYKMVCIYSKSEKTLFTICSEYCYEQLMKRKTIDHYHYSDIFCPLSSHSETMVQMNMYGEEIEINSQESVQGLLLSIMRNAPSNIEIKEYCMLTCRINHESCQLYSISAKYMSKKHRLIKEDNSWNSYINASTALMYNEEQGDVAPEMPINISIKTNIKLKDIKNKDKQLNNT